MTIIIWNLSIVFSLSQEFLVFSIWQNCYQISPKSIETNFTEFHRNLPKFHRISLNFTEIDRDKFHRNLPKITEFHRNLPKFHRISPNFTEIDRDIIQALKDIPHLSLSQKKISFFRRFFLSLSLSLFLGMAMKTIQ